MNNLKRYIIEKLKLNKDSKADNNPDNNFKKGILAKLEVDTEDLTMYWDKEQVEKIYNMTDSIVERYQLCYIIQEYCKINASEYNDIDHVLMYFTDKGNIALYYDKHYLGTYSNINGYPIDKEFLKKFNLLVEGH